MYWKIKQIKTKIHCHNIVICIKQDSKETGLGIMKKEGNAILCAAWRFVKSWISMPHFLRYQMDGNVRDYFQAFSWSKQMIQHYNQPRGWDVSNRCWGSVCLWEKSLGRLQRDITFASILPYIFRVGKNILYSGQSSLTLFPLEKWTTLFVCSSQSRLCLMKIVVFLGTSKLHAA